jgi:hypothetical protein
VSAVIVAPTAPDEEALSLDALAARIKAEHDAVREHAGLVARRARAAGELLLQAKQKLKKHGRWLQWLATNCSLSERTAQVYMRIAKYALAHPERADEFDLLTFRGMLAAIAAAKSATAAYLKIVENAKAIPEAASAVITECRDQLAEPAKTKFDRLVSRAINSVKRTLQDLREDEIKARLEEEAERLFTVEGFVAAARERFTAAELRAIVDGLRVSTPPVSGTSGIREVADSTSDRRH